MRLTLSILALLAVALSSANAAEYHSWVEYAEKEAIHAECNAKALPVLSPWYEYMMFREAALEEASDAMHCVDVAWMFANAASLTKDAQTYQFSVAKCRNSCDEALSHTRICWHQIYICREFFKVKN